MIARIHKAIEENKEAEGFTLIELLVVIIIIGILAAIAIPIFLNQRKKAYNSAVQNDLHSAALAEESYMTDNGNYYAGVSNALTPADTTLVADGLKFSPVSDYSASPQTITVYTYDTSGTAATGSTATGGFCLQATSSGGKTYVYDSANGGLQSTGSSETACNSATDSYVAAGS